MKIPSLKKSKNWLIVGGGVGMIFILYAALCFYAEKKIVEKIEASNGSVTSATVSLLSRSISVVNFEWSSPPDSLLSKPHVIKIKNMGVSGIGLYNLLVNKTVDINKILLDSGEINFNAAHQNNSQKKKQSSKYKNFSIGKIELSNIDTHVFSDSTLNVSALSNITLKDVSVTLDSTVAPLYDAKSIQISILDININRNEGLYGVSADRFAYDSELKEMTIDSARLIPNYEKYEFAKQVGKQTDRINVSIPQLLIKGIDYRKLFDTAFVARKIEIHSFDLKTFRDKRIPFYREGTVPMPMESFIGLPIDIKVDSITIHESQITIEEIPEDRTESIVVPFDHVNAVFSSLNNRIKGNDNPKAELNASGVSFGGSSVNATFLFPLDGSPSYHATGSITHLPLKSLNPILLVMGDIQIESGNLNSLSFDFSYSDFASKGHVETIYENLSVTSLKDNKNLVSGIKTFLINLIVKEDKPKEMAKRKRTGEIDTPRDRKRFIFKVWWKSILDGLKDSIL